MPSKNSFFVTTSWDDGDVLDVKLAEMLDRHGAKGTFYIAKEYRPNRLSEEQIRSLSSHHEIGAHTLTHPDLRALLEGDKTREIAEGKEWLEKIVGKEVPMFCYPKGYYDAASVEAVQKAGFRGARTTQAGSIAVSVNPFEIATSMQAYPLPFRRTPDGKLWWGKLFEPVVQRREALRAAGVSLWNMRSFSSAAQAAFDYAYKHGTVFHLWGHSWEVEQYDLWGELETFFVYVASKPNVRFVTNGELVAAGNSDGGWCYSPQGLRPASIVYSFGAGFDISFEKNLIQKHGVALHSFDPSPKSIAWLKTQTTPERLVFHPYGLGVHDGEEVFYPPPNPNNVSYSSVRKIGVGEQLPVKKLSTIMRELGHSHIDLLKLDIEGSEYEVLQDMLREKIFPTQVLVEFHDRFVGSPRSKSNIASLYHAGYRLLSHSNGEEYSFIRL